LNDFRRRERFARLMTEMVRVWRARCKKLARWIADRPWFGFAATDASALVPEPPNRSAALATRQWHTLQATRVARASLAVKLRQLSGTRIRMVDVCS
jgi:hypothetical protein